MRLFFVICSCLFISALRAQQPSSKSPEVINIKTIEGKPFAWTTGSGQLTAFVFLSPDCPLSRNYTLVLKEMQRSRKDVLQVVGVFPGNDHTDSEIKAFKEKYAINFVLVHDKKDALVKYTCATITPEVFLYDSHKALVYKGAIDDWAISLGKKRTQAEHHYLSDAIDNFLQHKQVSPSETKAVGCFISNR